MILFTLLACLVTTKSAFQPIHPNRNIDVTSNSAVNVNVAFFQQKLDHLDLFSTENFSQRYLFSEDFANNKNIAFLFVSEEANFEASLISDEKNQFVKNAKQFGATTFALEHRFYGASKPFDYLNSTSLKYVTSLQAIMDIAEFINYANKTFSLNSNVKWILFGAGYGGVLAAEARKMFPHHVTGVVASSAPVKHTYDFWEYLDQVKISIEIIDGGDCVSNIRQAFKDVGVAMTTVEGRANLSDSLQLATRLDQTNLTDKDIQTLYSSLISPFSQAVVLNNEFGIKVSQVCSIMRNSSYDSIQKIYQVNQYVFNGQLPFNSVYSQMINVLSNQSTSSEYADSRIWYWQLCTEFGFFQTTNTNNNQSLFGAVLPTSWYVNTCIDLFPDATISATTIRDSVETYNNFYGAADEYTGTNVVFTNGFLDPMARLGKESSSDFSVVVYVIAEASYASDMFPGNSSNNYIAVAHNLVTDNINTWFTSPPNPITFINTTQSWSRPSTYAFQSPDHLEFSKIAKDVPSSRTYPKKRLNKKVTFGRPPHGLKPAPDAAHFVSMPAGFEEGTFRQRVDHFNNTNPNYFQQKYFKNSQWARENGPNFFMIGGEGPESSRWVLNENITYLTWAKKYGATVYLLEHRFYGDSLVGDNTQLQYLSSLQMLYDCAAFIRAVNRKSSTIAPWITFGGSYSGAMSAWMREVFPDLVSGAVASSGPVYAKTDFYEYLMVVETAARNYDPKCADNIQAGFAEMQKFFNTKEGRTNLNSLFTLQPAFGETIRDVDRQYFFSTIFGNFQGAVQYSGDNTGAYANGYGIPDMCKIMTNTSNSPLQNIANFNVFMTTFYNGEFTGTDNLYEDMVEEIRDAQKYGPNSAAELLWTWQTCSEFGYFQTADSGNGIFGSATPVNMYIQLCQDLFGNGYDRKYIDSRIDYTNYKYGSRNKYRGTNVVFPNGNVDPWHALGLYTYGKSSIVPYLINGTAHCADMYPARAEDVPGLKIVRDLIDNNIAQWLNQFHNNTGSVTTTITTLSPGGNSVSTASAFTTTMTTTTQSAREISLFGVFVVSFFMF